MNFMKTIILFSLFFSQVSWAYEPMAKLECRKRISPAQFLYFEVMPITMNGGHTFQLYLYENNQLAYEKTAELSAYEYQGELFYKNAEMSLTVQQNKDFHTQLHFTNDPVIKSGMTADCTYYVPIEDFH
jgi:hypothetical protein